MMEDLVIFDRVPVARFLLSQNCSISSHCKLLISDGVAEVEFEIGLTNTVTIKWHSHDFWLGLKTELSKHKMQKLLHHVPKLVVSLQV